MPSDVQYNKSSGMIEIVFSGEVTASDLREAVGRRVEIQKATGAKIVLSDASEVKITPSTMDLFDLPWKLYPEHTERQTKMAVVLPKNEQAREMVKFLETASKNRGWLVQVFDDRQSAVAWLMEERTSNKP